MQLPTPGPPTGPVGLKLGGVGAQSEHTTPNARDVTQQGSGLAKVPISRQQASPAVCAALSARSVDPTNAAKKLTVSLAGNCREKEDAQR